MRRARIHKCPTTKQSPCFSLTLHPPCAVQDDAVGRDRELNIRAGGGQQDTFQHRDVNTNGKGWEQQGVRRGQQQLDKGRKHCKEARKKNGRISQIHFVVKTAG